MAEKKKQKIVKKILGLLLLGFFVFSSSLTHAQEDPQIPPATPPQTTLSDPVQKQIIQLSDEGTTKDDWKISTLETYGLKFLVRGKDALTWSLNIKDGGFHNPAIEKSYSKVLTIVNGMFILGLLAIAAMWMFSILIPRRYLKKVILIYSLAAVFINFSLPVNQLFIDGTNLLQKTLLTEGDGSIKITDIVQTPNYSDVLGYKDEGNTAVINEKAADKATFKLNGVNEDSTIIGKISVPQGETVTEDPVSLSNQEISLLKDRQFNVHEEQTWFRFLLLILTGIAYFIIALIFILRIVILWALLILSPILLLLSIFKSTRGWFYNWLSMYGRWLLIGPIAALGIAVVVNIWQLSGLPISMNDGYVPEVFSADKISNILFYLPGKTTPNTLSNTQDMMEYIIFLIMLYLPIFLAFALTRQKVLQESLAAVTKTMVRHSKSSEQQLIQQVLATHEHEKEEAERDRPRGGIINSFKNLVNDRIGFWAEKAMPLQKMKTDSKAPISMMPTASNFLPENLSQTPIFRMFELLGQNKDEKGSHQKIIEKMARIETITDKKEKEKIMAVKNEVEKRSESKDKEAMTVMREVSREVYERSTENTHDTEKTNEASHADSSVVGEVKANSGLNLTINESKSGSEKKANATNLKQEGDKKDKKDDVEKDKKENEGEKEREEKEPETENSENSKKEEETTSSEKQVTNNDDHAN